MARKKKAEPVEDVVTFAPIIPSPCDVMEIHPGPVEPEPMEVTDWAEVVIWHGSQPVPRWNSSRQPCG
jgi:hypothetical protein